MKRRIYQDNAKKEELQIVFRLLEPYLRPIPPTGGRRLGKKASMEIFQWTANDYGKLLHGNYALPSYQDRIYRILRKYKLTPYFDEGGEIILRSGNPQLSRVLKEWLDDSPAGVGYYHYHYASTKSPRNSTGQTREELLRQALLVIHYGQAEAGLFFFSSPEHILSNSTDRYLLDDQERVERALTEDIDRWVAARYHGTVSYEKDQDGTMLYLSFDQRVDRAQHEAPAQTFDHKGLVSFRVNTRQRIIARSQTGNFASVGPASGLCYVEQITKEDIPRIFSDQAIDLPIRHLLVGKSYSLNNHSELYDVGRHQRLLQAIEDYVATYACYSLISRSGQEALGVARFTIHPDGRIVIQTVHSPEMSGYIFYVTDLAADYPNSPPEQQVTALSCCVNYSHQHDHHKMFMVIQVKGRIKGSYREVMKDCLPGSYSGLFQRDDFPQSGRMLLRRLKQGEEVHVHNYLFRHADQVSKIFAKYPYLLSFFSGQTEDIADRPLDMIPRLMDRHHFTRLHYTERRRTDRFVGAYVLYYPSSRHEDRVYRCLLEIQEQTHHAVWHDKFDRAKGSNEIVGENYLGAAVLINKNLTIRFNEKVYLDDTSARPPEVTERSCVFSIAEYPEGVDPKGLLFGKIYRQNTLDNPVVSEAILEKIDQLPIQENRANSVKSIPRDKLENEVEAWAAVIQLLPPVKEKEL